MCTYVYTLTHIHKYIYTPDTCVYVCVYLFQLDFKPPVIK